MARRAPALGVLALLALLGLGAPKVEVYARSRIDIDLLKNGENMPNVLYGDFTFDEKGQFQRLVHVPFTPTKGDIFICRVEHSSMPEPPLVLILRDLVMLYRLISALVNLPR
uniref:Immunoglobulin C1-set domain-containing protein n=1 Tax=Malurus cyaneus samueli TaxID=2593467 RepID=A0A8C5UAF7_9PASS